MPLILDFDGVIADSGEVVLEVINLIAKARGQPPLGASELAAVDPQALRRAWGLRLYEIPGLVRRARREMAARWQRLRLCPQIRAPLAWAQRHGVPRAIVSSNAATVIEALTDRDLPGMTFSARIGDVSLWRKHHTLSRLVRQHGWPPDATVYLGDEARDMVAAGRAGLTGWGASWGKDSAATLTAAGAARVVDGDDQLIAALAEHTGLGRQLVR